jgi:hypothetical protein
MASSPTRKTFLRWTLGAGIVHAALSVVSIAFLSAAAMRRFDETDTASETSVLERLLSGLPEILLLPGRLLHTRWVSQHDFVEWTLFLANSLLWGAAVAAFVLFQRGRALPP